MAVVMDANVAISIAEESEEGLAIQSLIMKDEDIYAPDFFCLEVASGFWKYVHAGHMKQDIAEKYYRAACNIPNRFIRQNDLVTEALHEAIRFDHSIYDMIYFALARRLNATFASLDRRLIDLCEAEGIDCVVPVNADTSAT